jgi:hypothetical protein
MYKCAYCRYRGPEVAYSPTFSQYLCDECFTDANDAREDENITSCYPIAE